MKETTIKKLAITLSLIGVFMFISETSLAQNIFNDIKNAGQTQVNNAKPLVSWLIGLCIIGGILIGGGILMFSNSQQKYRNAGGWAGGFFLGAILLYVGYSMM